MVDCSCQLLTLNFKKSKVLISVSPLCPRTKGTINPKDCVHPEWIFSRKNKMLLYLEATTFFTDGQNSSVMRQALEALEEMIHKTLYASPLTPHSLLNAVFKNKHIIW